MERCVTIGIQTEKPVVFLLVGGDVAEVVVISKFNSNGFEISGQVRMGDGGIHEACGEFRSVHLLQFLQ